MSILTAYSEIQERSEATPGLFNRILSTLSANIRTASEGPFTSASTDTLSFTTNISVSGGGQFQFLSVGSTPPSEVTTAAIIVAVNSASSDYLYLNDSSGARSNYVIGSRAGGTADGLNIWDASGDTMIASFSKQSVRFWQNVVGPVFDVGGALADTYNAATFGTGADSTESRIQAAIDQAVIDSISRVYVPASMYPYSSGSVSFNTSVQMVREGGNWAVYDAQAYGARGNNTGDDAPAIKGAIAAAEAATSGIIFIPNGDYQTQSTITVSKSGIVIEGTAAQYNTDVGSLDWGSKILYNGPVGAHAVVFSPSPIGASARALKRSGMRDIGIRGQNRAENCLLIQSDQGGYFGRIYIDGARSYGMVCSSVTTLGENRDNQECVFDGFMIRMTSAGSTLFGGGILLDGDGTTATNINYSDFYNIHIVHSHGTGLQINNADDVRFWGIKLFRTSGGTGPGVELSGGTSDALACRANYFGFLSVGDGGLTARTNSRDNIVSYYAMANGEPAPVVESAATLFWTTSGNAAGSGVAQWRLGTASFFTGSARTPAWGFNSEASLGFYSSASSTINQSYGTFSVAGPIVSTAIGMQVVDGTAVLPAMRFGSEASLGWYRSGTSRMVLSYGTLTVSGRIQSTSVGYEAPGGIVIEPSYRFGSEASLGLLRSAASTIAQSYGTFTVDVVRASGRTLQIATAAATGDSGTAAGVAGQIKWAVGSGATWLYLCTSANSWMRVALSPF